MPFLADSDNFFSSQRWLRAVALSKRTLHEGFGAFALSIALFTIGLCLLRIWWLDRINLQTGIQQQILRTVSISQEPTDANDTGLISAALANLNLSSEDPCADPYSKPFCQAIAKFHRTFADSFNQKLIEAAQDGGETIEHYPLAQNDPARPELAQGPLCKAPKGDSVSYVLLPAQFGSYASDPRITQVVAASSALDDTLLKYQADHASRPLFDSLVQAYFISTDSLLRIWSKLEPNVCKDFSPTKLWASKNYFAFFWDHPEKKSYTSPTYIDYGGNGLVQTRCEEVDQNPNPQNPTPSQHEKLLGVMCLDFKSDRLIDDLHNQLFFETATITFPESYNPSLAKVELPARETPSQQQPAATSRDPSVSELAVGAVNEKRSRNKPMPSETASNPYENAAIGMQGTTLKEADVRQALKDIPNPGSSLRREITHVPFHGGTAFLIPLGPPSGKFKALFFYPRSPALSRADLWFEGFGFGLLGAAIASAALGSRLRTRAGQLRERLSLLRSMQIAFLQVDKDDYILEANDRAEELFHRLLPKPGMPRHKVKFSHLIGARLVQKEEAYKELTNDEISRMRSRGEASSYYARLCNEELPQWFQVSATPLMHPGHEERSDGSLYLGSISATAHEVPSEIAERLEQALRQLKEGAN